YAAAKLLPKPKTLIHQPCIKSCIKDKIKTYPEHRANPFGMRGSLFLCSFSVLPEIAIMLTRFV
ncbi:hypothetical protein, partial [Metabacillus rhizolycopersici]